MINLNNDVLNEDRRKLFPKIHTMSNKFSFNTMAFLKQQKPYNNYHSFYYKYIEKQKRKKFHFMEKKSPVNSLSIISKTRNFYFSLPIKIDTSFANSISTYDRNLELNKFQKEFHTRNRNYLRYENSQINYIDFSRHKELQNLHNNLMGEKKYSGNSMDKIGIKNESIKLLKKYKRNKSYVNKRINDNNNLNEILKKNLNIKNFNKRLRNNISNNKISREQQTIDSEFTNIKEEISYKNELKKNSTFNDGYKYSSPKKKYDEEGNKFNIKFLNNKKLNVRAMSRNDKKSNLNNLGDKFTVKVFWSNMKKPLIFNSLFNSMEN